MEERRILEVSVLARGLPKLDMFSRTNPFVVVFKSEGGGGVWKEVGRTETIADEQDPRFVEKFLVAFTLRNVRSIVLRFDFFSRTSKNTNDLSAHNFVGTVQCQLAELIETLDQGMALRLQTKQNRTEVAFGIIQGELFRQLENPRGIIFNAEFGRIFHVAGSRAYYEISRSIGPRRWALVHRSETIRLGKTSKFEHSVLDEQELTAGNQKHLRLEVFTAGRFQKNFDSQGSAVFRLEELMSATPGRIFKCVDRLDTRPAVSDRQVMLFDANQEGPAPRFNVRLQNF
uniref:C2 domain-containing protein n=2 Tax=Rhodosorus marinus TaxID=101924 RepID=A0A7S3ACW3_9RHOD|mmetsp:Transcript_9623/g.41407  ORF Transcript_9623/g.41407 Transcript_9623/m.41407 type:complete len:287 (+) Transcript_9623:555-1415(+)|eukprot:CAMPEP_0113957480 /NCGR_PEP_ID=MMETSP0011_2-20120614/2804_1 /TAXON_ID=101924 /ORGANISM="Rhodosorus marinus" /LENGTH=286 /DNA_ID=CAMNT_0000968069 /DNA_START=447 /DNA_END=1307 /DNA_ORIENTATION=+ /assembly_acc=CAM_ASM_000156